MRRFLAVYILLAIIFSAHSASGFVRYTVVDPLDGRVYPTAWDRRDFPIRYMVNVDGSDDIGDDSEFLAIRTAFDAWQGVETASVSFRFYGFTASRQTGYDGVNLVVFSRDDPDFEGATTVATTDIFVFFPSLGQSEARIVDADIRLNDDFVFSTAEATPPLGRDVQAVLTHEIGHLLGLDHSPIAGRPGTHRQATMFPRDRPGQNQERSLEPDDIAGVSAIYPSEGFFALTGSISGRVLEGDGAPVSGAHVVAYAAHEPQVPLLGSISGMGGNAIGEYRLQGLWPGRYLVRLEPLGASFRPSDFLGQGPSMALASEFAPEYFDDANYISEASEINVEAGLDIGGVDFILGSPSPPSPPKIEFVPDGGLQASPFDLKIRMTSPIGLGQLNLTSFSLKLNGQPVIAGEDLMAARQGLGATLRSAAGSILEIHLPGFLLPEGISHLLAEVSSFDGAVGRNEAQFISSPLRPERPLPLSGRLHLDGDAEIDFQLDGGYQVSGMVIDAGGYPLLGGSLRFISDGAEVASATLRSDGRYSAALRPGRYDVQLYIPGMTQAAASARLDLYRDTQLDMTLSFAIPRPPPAEPLPLLHGTVVDQLGRVLPHAQVEVYAEGSTSPVARGATNDLGIYQIVLEPGVYRIRARPRGSLYPFSHPIPQEVENLLVASNIRLDFSLPNGFALSGRVQDSRRVPMAFANIRVFSSQGTPVAALGADVDGRFHMPLPTGAYSLTIDPPFSPPEGSRAVSATIPNIPLERDTEVDIALPDGFLLSGSVLKPSGEPASFARLRALSPRGGRQAHFFASDGSGRFSIALPAGDYSLVVEPPTLLATADKTVRTVVRNIVLQRDTTLAITLDEGVEMRGRVLSGSGEGLAGAEIFIAGFPQDLPFSATSTAGADGSYRLVLPPGGFTIRVRPPRQDD